MRSKTFFIALSLMAAFAMACSDNAQDDKDPTVNHQVGSDAGLDAQGDPDAVSSPDTEAEHDAPEQTDTQTQHDVGTGEDAELDGDGHPDDENLLFRDDFASGDLATHNDYFRWGQGAVPGPGAGSGRIVTVQGPHGTDVQALRFRYVGIDDGGAGDQAHFSEQRFALTRSADEDRDSTRPSDVSYPEVWISYWLYVPENYHHNLTGGTISGANQKGWLYLWKDRYERWTSAVSDDEVTPTSASLHWWPATEDQTRDDYGLSRASLVASRERSRWGHRTDASFVRDAERVGSSSEGYVFLRDEFGTWVHYTFGARVASDADTPDGFVRIYKDGELFLAWENLDLGSDSPQTNGFDRGYLLGYHNAAYTRTTIYYLADFKFGLTRESVR
jgi:hypothetical protein